ncbi:MFS transporter [Pseudogracilibacillus auburnensis]|uniref:MFS transporter n=1 Tax=Pseudogracilibacillus auburnensis TaxID=1494959 RepID=A0A2V3W199_9BACI|nr:MFS transporter [Pseudogracilibacillus auburnensis]
MSEPTKPKIDIISVLLSTIGFGGFVYGFSGSEGGFTGIIVVSIIALILFVFRQIRLKEPLLDLRAFKYPMFAVTTVLLIVVMMTLFSTLSLLPFLFQGALGLTVFASGLLLLPGSFVNGLMSPVAGKLFDRFGPRVLVIPATGMVVIIMWFFMQVSMNTSKITFLVLHICLMFALSMIMMPAQTNGLNQLPPRYYPHGIAILNTLSQIAGAIGVAFFIGVMTAGQHRFLEQSSDPSSPAEISEGLVAGINNAFMYGFALACIAFVLALFIKRTQPPKE